MPPPRRPRPAISRLRPRSSAASAGTSPAMRPSYITRIRSDEQPDLVEIGRDQQNARRLCAAQREQAARGSTPSRRRRRRGSAVRRAGRSGAAPAPAPPRASADCRRRTASSAALRIGRADVVGAHPRARECARRRHGAAGPGGSSRRLSGGPAARSPPPRTPRRRPGAAGPPRYDRGRGAAARRAIARSRRLPSSPDRAGLRRPQPDQGLDQLRLTVARDARDTHDLAAPDAEADAVDALDAVRVDRRSPRRPSSTGSPARRRRLRRRQRGRAADHQRRQAPRASCSWFRVSATTAPWRITVTTSVTAMTSLSLCVTRRIVLPGAREGAQLVEERAAPRSASARRSARRGSGSRRRGAAPSGSPRAASGRRAESRPARRDRASASWLSREAREARARGRPRLAPSARPRSCPSTRFSSTVMVSTSMKCWCTMPIPAAIASRGLADRDGAAVDPDLAGVGRGAAVEDAAQRRLPGAVLADQAVDRAAREAERDRAVGVHRAEALVDAAELDRGRCRRSRRELLRHGDLARDDVGARRFRLGAHHPA